MMFFNLEITTSPGNGLCNLQKYNKSRKSISKNENKKLSLSLQHLHTIALLQTLLIRNRVLWHKVKFIENFRIVSRATLQGSESREFDTPSLNYGLR